jgi:DNA-binding transcriptional regulator YiaG
MRTMASTKPKTWRRGRPRAAQLAQPDYPFTMKLHDGRTVYVEVPGRWVTTDRSGEVAFLPEAVEFLDKVQALAMTALDRAPSPAYVTALRQALGMTQQEFGERLGVNKLTISRWERGTLRPGPRALAALEALRREAVRRGVTIPA